MGEWQKDDDGHKDMEMVMMVMVMVMTRSRTKTEKRLSVITKKHFDFPPCTLVKSDFEHGNKESESVNISEKRKYENPADQFVRVAMEGVTSPVMSLSLEPNERLNENYFSLALNFYFRPMSGCIAIRPKFPTFPLWIQIIIFIVWRNSFHSILKLIFILFLSYDFS